MVDSEQGTGMEGSEADLLRRPTRTYYSIREVSELLGVKAHVLRYWETQFPYLRPRKHRGGARMYQDRDLDLLRAIREMLYDRGYTIAGARQRLNDERRQAENARSQIEMDFVPPSDRRQLREVRDELANLLAWLQEKPGTVLRRGARFARGKGAAEPAFGESEQDRPPDISIEPGEAPR